LEIKSFVDLVRLY